MGKKYLGILFDLDGTLLDTTEGVKDAVILTHKELGMVIPDEITLLRFVGPPMQDSFIREYGFSVEKAQRAANIFRKNYMEKSLYLASMYPNVLQTLFFLKRQSYKIGVATYKREDYAIDLLQHFGIAEFCDVIHGGDNFNLRKKADIVNMCIDEMEISDRSKVILVGDSEYDASGAEQAGVNFWGVTYGYGFNRSNYMDLYKAIGWGNSIEKIKEIL